MGNVALQHTHIKLTFGLDRKSVSLTESTFFQMEHAHSYEYSGFEFYEKKIYILLFDTFSGKINFLFSKPNLNISKT